MREGYVESVDTKSARSFTVADAASGQPNLVVQSGYEFLEADSVTVDGATFALSSVVLGDLEDETATSILVLGSNLSALVEAGEPVDVTPEQVTTWAKVSIPGELDTVTVRVPQSPQLTLPLGIRTPESREIVTYDDGIDGPEVTSIQGRATIDGSLIDPSTLPPVEPVAPASSPEPKTIGGLRQVFVKYDAIPNETLVEYEVHVTADPAAPAPVAGDPATLAKDDPSTLVALSTLPDTAPFVYDEDADTDPETPNTPKDYYFAVFAHSGDQYAPAPSTWVAGRMDKTASGDLVAGSVTTEVLNSVLAILGTLNIGGGLIELSPPTSTPNGMGGYTLGGGIVIKDPANPSGEPLVRLHPMGSKFRGELVADIITVLKDLVINGNARLSGGSTFTLTNGVPDPLTGPAWTVGPQVGQVWPAAPSGYERRGVAWDSTGTRWVELLVRTSTNRAYCRTVSTAGVAGTLTLLGRTLPSGGSDKRVQTGIAVVGTSVVFGWTAGATPDERIYVTKATISTGAQTVQVQVGGYAAGVGSLDYLSSVGQAGSDVLIQGIASGPGDFAAVLSASTLAEVKRTAVGSIGTPLSAIAGSFDFGSERIVAQFSGGQVRVFTPNWAGTVAEDTSKAWVAVDAGYGSLASDGSDLFSLNTGATTLTKWSSYYPSSDGVWSAVYQDLTTGGHTASSPATTATVPARNFVTLTLPVAPTGVTGADVWVGYAASGDAATKYKRAETLSGRTMALTGKSTSGSTTIPAGSTAGGSPAVIKSEATGWEGSGDGTFSVAAGTLSGHAVNKGQMDAAITDAVPAALQAGVNVAVPSGSGGVNVSVLFDTPFTSTPAVTLGVDHPNLVSPRVTASSTTGFTARFDRSGAATYKFDWIAAVP